MPANTNMLLSGVAASMPGSRLGLSQNRNASAAVNSSALIARAPMLDINVSPVCNA
jgi:hypothetical protein